MSSLNKRIVSWNFYCKFSVYVIKFPIETLMQKLVFPVN